MMNFERTFGMVELENRFKPAVPLESNFDPVNFQIRVSFYAFSQKKLGEQLRFV